MRRVILAVFLLLLVLLIGFAAYLLITDPKPEVTQVEQVIPNDRFQQ